ncbi:MAG: helix-turn-helix domain-containing protein [Armatimonadota bacterium]|nr:helix-turn-helix domain-containing protein [Armatimonadota bacterium]
MSRKEAPWAGLLKAALAGQVSNQQVATALHLSVRQVQRRKRRFRAAGIRGLVHRTRGQPSPRRLPAAVRQQVAGLLQATYQEF